MYKLEEIVIYTYVVDNTTKIWISYYNNPIINKFYCGNFISIIAI